MRSCGIVDQQLQNPHRAVGATGASLAGQLFMQGTYCCTINPVHRDFFQR